MTERPTERTPLDMLEALATQHAAFGGPAELLEIYTMGGLLMALRHGQPDAEEVVVMLGGAMGGFLGPAAVYHSLGEHLVHQGRAGVRVDYRRPDKLERSILDAAAMADLAMKTGGRRFVILGHSFGGAVAVQVGAALGDHCVGVATMATQSAGCEAAEHLGTTPLLLIHGERDVILGPQNSHMVQMMAGHGDISLIPSADHNFTGHHDELFEQLGKFIDTSFAAARGDHDAAASTEDPPDPPEPTA